MAFNKLALIRYKAIDECLQNKNRYWTLNDIVAFVSEVIFKTEGISSGVSKRTIQLDIETMRSNKLGYKAPIVVVNKKYYQYKDPNYSITNAPVNKKDIQKLDDIMGILKQFSEFSYFNDLQEIVARMENSIHTSQKQKHNYIQFEQIENLKGKQFLPLLYSLIKSKKSLLISYQSFKTTKESLMIIYPYLLKEFRNRWFLIGSQKGHTSFITLALDRMVNIQELPQEKFIENSNINFETFYADCIGVTKSINEKPKKVILEIDLKTWPYILTKPLHNSQRIVTKKNESIVIEINVCLNFELEKEILGFGESIVVLGPRIFKNKIATRVKQAAKNY